MARELSQSRIYRELLAAATDLDARRLWTKFAGDECFAVIVPGEEEPMFASITEPAFEPDSEDQGFLLFRGEAAWRHLVRMVEAPDEEMLDDEEHMGFSMQRFSDALPLSRKILKKGGARCHRESIVPCFGAKDAWNTARAITPDEAKKLLYVLRGVLKVLAEGKLAPRPVQEGAEIPLLRISGDPLSPEVHVESLFPDASPLDEVPMMDVPGDLNDLPRIPGRWLIGFQRLSAATEGWDPMRVLMIVDAESEIPLATAPVLGGVEEGIDVLFDVFRGEREPAPKGIPSEIIVDDKGFFRLIAPMLRSLGVTCRHKAHIPLLNEVFVALLEEMAYALSTEEPEKPAEPPPFTLVKPTPETIDEEDYEEDDWDEENPLDDDATPDDKDIASQNRYLLQRQEHFRTAAEYVAAALSKLPEVRKVVLFGSVSKPLKKEVPRFREYRRRGIEVFHECGDVDIAVWVSRLDNLKALQKARGQALNDLMDAENIGVAHHQVEIFLMDSGTDEYLGRLCCFGTCPKTRKPECLVEGCGATRFLKQHEDFKFDKDALREPSVVTLWERPSS